MQPLVNGIRHSWASIKTTMLGRTVSGISSIEYGDSQEKSNNYGAGPYPVSRGRGGRYEAECKITLHAYEVDAILAVLGQGERLTDIEPFDIIVTYMPEGSDGLINHVIRNCEFKTNNRSVQTGDTSIETEFDLIVSHIEWK